MKVTRIKVQLGKSTYNINTDLYPDGYGEKLAEQARRFGYMCYNYYEPIDNNRSYIICFSKAYGVIRSIVDNEDIFRLSKHTWRAVYSKRIDNFYMENTDYGKMHRFILGIPKGIDMDTKVDHIDRDPLNNSKINLRMVSQAENCRNSSLRSDNTSGIKGIRFDKSRNRWSAEIYVDNKKYTKVFAVSRYGYEEAKNMAIAFREDIASKNGYLNPFS
jgi:hypothetical protein